MRVGSVGRMERWVTEPQAAVGAEDTNRMTQAWPLPWSGWTEQRARGRDHGRDMCRRVTEDAVPREPERVL